MNDIINEDVIEKVVIKSVAIYKAMSELSPPPFEDKFVNKENICQQNEIIQSQNLEKCLNAIEPSKENEITDTTNEIKNDYEKKSWKDITNPKERKKAYNKHWRESNKDTIKAYHKDYYEANKNKVLLRNKNYYEVNKQTLNDKQKNYNKVNKDKIKACRQVNKDKLKNYNKDYYESNKDKLKISKKNYYKINKDKIKVYYDSNKDKICSYQKAYNESNKDKRKVQKKVYYEANKDKIKVYYNSNKDKIKVYRKANRDKINSYIKNKKKTDIQFKLSCNLRARLHSAINGNYKSGSAVKDLGCSIKELKQYLESKFLPGMTWDNWALDGWHIDHIKPLSDFDLTDRQQFLEACHYTNLQPLWATDNLSKSDKIL